MPSKSTRKQRRRKSAAIDKPPKPYPDFPLCPAHIGRWQKKINGKSGSTRYLTISSLLSVG